MRDKCRVHPDRESIDEVEFSDSDSGEEIETFKLCEECVLEFVETAGTPDSIEFGMGESQDR
jgi:hypothetical protein